MILLVEVPAATRDAVWVGTAIVGYSEPFIMLEPDPETGGPMRFQAGVFRYVLDYADGARAT